jgi:glycosyltransferase involved in cell wall biosynthesis
MPPRVTYWTGTWDPAQEAISKEIQTLRLAAHSRPLVASISSGQTSALNFSERVVRLSTRHWPLLRALAPLLERQGDVTHLFGSLDSWHLLRATGRRPTIMTVVIPGHAADPQICTHVRTFAVESERLYDELLRAGIPPERVRVIYPGVDLEDYRPGAAAPSGRFRVLFASSPADPREFDARGISLLIEAARLMPDVDVVLLWREWGDQTAANTALARLQPPPNVRLEYLGGRDMPAVYQGAHAVACIYAENFGKSCPNSVIEGLACGAPVVVGNTCGIASLITGAGAGFAVSRHPDEIASAVTALRSRHSDYARAARALAETHFDRSRFLAEYSALYRAAEQDVECAKDASVAVGDTIA